jgi:magnesium and cobalt transporter
MSEPHPARSAAADRPQNPSRSPLHNGDHRNLFQRLIEFLSPGVDSRDELIEALAQAEHRDAAIADTYTVLVRPAIDVIADSIRS